MIVSSGEDGWILMLPKRCKLMTTLPAHSGKGRCLLIMKELWPWMTLNKRSAVYTHLKQMMSQFATHKTCPWLSLQALPNSIWNEWFEKAINRYTYICLVQVRPGPCRSLNEPGSLKKSFLPPRLCHHQMSNTHPACSRTTAHVHCRDLAWVKTFSDDANERRHCRQKHLQLLGANGVHQRVYGMITDICLLF